MLNNGRAGLNPVFNINIINLANPMKYGMMNMTANDALHVVHVSDDGVFKGADEINGDLHLLLGISGKGPALDNQQRSVLIIV